MTITLLHIGPALQHAYAGIITSEEGCQGAL